MMLVTNKETIASVALVLLAGVFLYLGFTQGTGPWTQLAQSPATTTQGSGVQTEGSAPGAAPGADEKSAAPSGSSTVPQDTATPPAAVPEKPPGSLPDEAVNPLTGPASSKLKEKTGSDFFIEYRLERDRVRSQEVQMLRDLVNDKNTAAEAKTAAQQRLIRISGYMEQEMQIEALMKAKGYPEAAVFIQPNGVNIIVQGQELKTEELGRIGEAVARIANCKIEQVVITPWP